MKKIKLLSVAIAFIAVSLFIQSCKSEDGDYQLNNQEFVNEASSVDAFQIAAGNLAQTNGSAAGIKQFGGQMVAEHTAYNVELVVLTASKGWTSSKTMMPKEQTMYNTLRLLSGTAFDHKYSELMVSSNEESLDEFTAASGKNGVLDADLRNYAANKIVYLKNHIQQARAL